jgi:hypothetical protein
MEEKKEETRPDSLAPVTIPEVSVDEEAAAMNKGKRKTIIALVVVVAISFVGAGMFLQNADKKSAFREAGQTLNSLKKRQFNRFWGCALEGVNLSDIRSNADLVAKIELRSSVGRTRYGRMVRERCVDILEEVATALDVLQVPSELKPEVEGLKKATSQLRDGWREYLSYITDPDLSYDETKARRYLDKIALGWYGFSKDHAKLNKMLQNYLE